MNAKQLLNRETFFDPRILTEEESRQLWSSESVELAKKGLAEGYRLKESPFNERIKKAQLRRANLPFQYTPDELKIIQACMEDKIWFGNNFTKLKDGEHGWTQIKLRSYQEDILTKYTNHRFNILMVPRQSGKTTTTIIEIVHFLCFNYDKDVVVVAQSDAVVTEILEKIRYCFEGLPFFLQPGFKKFTDDGAELDNGCRLKVTIAGPSCAQGFSLDLLFVDEFAYISDNLAETFWVNIYPTLTNNPKSRCIIASTPNGRNLFHTLWTGAINKTNTFIPTRYYWHEIPGRTEQFKIDTIKNIGLLGWELGYECNFDVGMKTIFNTSTQKRLRSLQIDCQNKWISNTSDIDESVREEFESNNSVIRTFLLFEDFYVRSDVKYSKSDYLIITTDIGEGLEQDSSVIKIIKPYWSIKNQRLEFDVIAVFHSNLISIESLAEKMLRLIKMFDNNRIRVVVETNTYGGEFFQVIDNNRRYNPEFSGSTSNEVFVQFKRSSDANDYERGLRWNKYNKPIAVKNYATMISTEEFVDSYPISIEESMNFCRKKGDVFAANYGHDDHVMANLSAISFIKATDLKSISFWKMVIREERIKVDDEPIEVRLKRELENKKKAQVYVSQTGFVERDTRTEKKTKISGNLFM